MLQASADQVAFAVLDEPVTGLLEEEGDVLGDALLSDGEHPIIVAGAGRITAFSSHGHLLDGKKRKREADWTENRLADDFLVPEGEVQEQWKAPVRLPLVLHGDAEGDMFPPIPPVRGQAGTYPSGTFGDDGDGKVVPQTDHVPDFLAPRVGLVQEEVAGHATIQMAAGRNLAMMRPVHSHGQVVVLGLGDQRGVFADSLVPAVDVAVLATFAVFRAAVPGIPDDPVHQNSIWPTALG